MKILIGLFLIVNLSYGGLLSGGKSLLSKLSIIGGSGASITSDSNKHDIENITLQPKWHEQFQFAGYYMAKHKGFYKEANLNVTIKSYTENIGSITDMVLNEESNITYGIGGSSLVLDILRNKDIILLKSILQESPVIILSLAKNTLNDSKNKRMMVSKNEFKNVVFQSILNMNSNDARKDFKLIYKSPPKDALIKDETDFMIAYKTNEPFFLKSKGYKDNRDYLVYSAEEKGLKFYSDILFTSKKELEEHPSRVEKFTEASMKGWEVAFSDINKTAKFIYKNYNEHNKSLEALIFEGNELKKMAKKRNVEFGYISANRLKEIENYHANRGMMGTLIPKDNYNDYIYSEWHEKLKYRLLQELNYDKVQYLLLYSVLFIIILMVGIPYWIFSLRKKVQEGVDKYKEQAKITRQQTKLLKKLEKQKRMETDITKATHQLRSPLGSIAAIINNLKRDAESNGFNNDTLDEALSKIERQSTSMRGTIEFFLDSLSGDNIKIENFSINKVLYQSLEDFDPIFRENEIEIICDINKNEDFTYSGSKFQLSEVFKVLFQNAIDALMENKKYRTISIKIEEAQNNNVNILIADNAKGISPNILKRIFILKFSNKNKSKNKGLGLSIAKELVEENLNGSLIAYNDKGAVFKIVLPLLD